MTKQTFGGWIVLLLAGGLFSTGFLTELSKKIWDLQSMGLLLLFAYLIYRASTDK